MYIKIHILLFHNAASIILSKFEQLLYKCHFLTDFSSKISMKGLPPHLHIVTHLLSLKSHGLFFSFKTIFLPSEAYKLHEQRDII